MTEYFFYLYLKWLDLINAVTYFFHEKPRGIDFAKSEWVYPDASDNIRYERTPKKLIEKTMLNTVSKEANILDVGCGKGYFIYYMKRLGYKNVDGLEYNEDLLEIAVNNFDVLQMDDINLYHADAATFDGLDSYQVIYLFNPFKAFVMLSFIRRLQESLRRNPRNLTVVYLNPLEHHLWNASAYFEHLATRQVQQFPFKVQAAYYVHNPDRFWD